MAMCDADFLGHLLVHGDTVAGGLGHTVAVLLRHVVTVLLWN